MKDSMFAGFTGTSYIDNSCSGVGIAIFSWDLATGIILASDSTDPHKEGGHDHRRAARNGALAAATAVSLVVVVVLTVCLRQQRKACLPANVDGGGGVMRMRYSALCKATGGFSDRNKIGEGAFGVVYKGELPDGSTVAVKRLKRSMRRDEEFATEMKVIGSIRHWNLLEMKWWCYERGEAVLVYEYMSNGNMDDYLFGDAGKPFVAYTTREEGKTRLSIPTDVAAALSYLHSSLGKCVLHRDVKATNVLLTANMEARLADFGMARLVQHDHSVMPSVALGTVGYIAPEVTVTAKISDKADVYGFSVLMLETACGRRAISAPMSDRQRKIVSYSRGGRGARVAEIEEKEEEAQHVVAHVAQHLRGGTMSAALHPLLWQGDDEEWKWVEVLYMGLACCQYSAAARPCMTDVHRMLQNLGHATAPAEMVLPMCSSLALHELATDVLLPHAAAAAAAAISARWFDSSIFDSSSLLLLPRPP